MIFYECFWNKQVFGCTDLACCLPVWGFDFHGYGFSDPYPAMNEPAEHNRALGCGDDGSRQIERVVRFKRRTADVCSHVRGPTEKGTLG